MARGKADSFWEEDEGAAAALSVSKGVKPRGKKVAGGATTVEVEVKSVCIRVPVDLWRKLRKIAAVRDVSLSDLVTEVLEEKVGQILK